MEVIQFFRPKNFQVKEVFKGTDELIPVDTLRPGEVGRVDYYFGGKLYRHFGEWPPVRSQSKFRVPVFRAEIDEIDVTDEFKKLQGPTNTKILLGLYSPRIHVSFSFLKISMRVKWILKKKLTGLLKITDIFGSTHSYIVE